MSTSSVIGWLVGALLGMVLNWFVLLPWLERRNTRRNLERRLERWREMNKLADPEDQLTEAQLKDIEQAEREYWEIH